MGYKPSIKGRASQEEISKRIAEQGGYELCNWCGLPNFEQSVGDMREIVELRTLFESGEREDVIFCNRGCLASWALDQVLKGVVVGDMELSNPF